MKTAQTQKRRTISFPMLAVLIFTLQAVFTFSAVAASAEGNYLDQKMGLVESVSFCEPADLPPIAQAAERTGMMASLTGWVSDASDAVVDKAVGVGTAVVDGVVDSGKYLWGKIGDGRDWTVDRVEDAIDISIAVGDAILDTLEDAAVLTKELVDEAEKQLKEALIEAVEEVVESLLFISAVEEAWQSFDKLTLDPLDPYFTHEGVVDIDALTVLQGEIGFDGNVLSDMRNSYAYASDHLWRSVFGYTKMLNTFDVADWYSDFKDDGEIDSLRNYADQHAPERMVPSYVNPCIGAMYAQLAGDCYEINSTNDTNTASTVSNGWEIIEVEKHFFSDFEAVLYKNTDKGSDYDGEYVLAFRGTEFSADLYSKVNDLWADAAGNPAGIEEQYIEAAQYAMELQAKGYSNLKLVGHSLGGGLAQYASYQTGLEAITYNAADPGHWIVGDGTTGYSDNITNYRYYNDSISALNIATYEAGLTYRLGTDYYLQGDASEFMEAHDWKTLRSLLGDKCSEEKDAGGSSLGEGDDEQGSSPNDPNNPDNSNPSDSDDSKPKYPWTIGIPPGWTPPSCFKETYEKKDYQDTFY